MEVDGGFSHPCPSNFFPVQTFEADKTSNTSGAHLLCPMQIMGALQAKKRNSEEKSKNKILNSSPVSIFFDNYPFLAAI